MVAQATTQYVVRKRSNVHQWQERNWLTGGTETKTAVNNRVYEVASRTGSEKGFKTIDTDGDPRSLAIAVRSIKGIPRQMPTISAKVSATPRLSNPYHGNETDVVEPLSAEELREFYAALGEER